MPKPSLLKRQPRHYLNHYLGQAYSLLSKQDFAGTDLDSMLNTQITMYFHKKIFERDFVGHVWQHKGSF